MRPAPRPVSATGLGRMITILLCWHSPLLMVSWWTSNFDFRMNAKIARLAIADGEKWKRKNTERNVKSVSVSAICFCPTSWNIRCWMIYPSWLIVLKYAAAIIHLTRARLLRGLPGHKTVNFFSPPVKSEMSRWKVEQPHCGLQFWSVIVVKKLTKNCRFSLSLSLLYI